jgi:divalent metal cation (Fe/Co/Zn/Cd) transporter
MISSIAIHDRGLLRRGLILEYFTLSWNVVGVVVLGFAAIGAHSVALAGFGLDSLVEIGASLVVVWQLTGDGAPERERRALSVIACAFFALAIYIAMQSSYLLITGGHPGHSMLGITWTGATCAVMLALAYGKTVTGSHMGSRVLRAEGLVTLADALLASAVLLGVCLNATLGWWWADPLAGFVIVVYGMTEGIKSWGQRA